MTLTVAESAALAALEAALKIADQYSTLASAKVRLATNLGDLNADLGRYKEAERYLQEAVAGARRLHSQVSPATRAQPHERMQKSFSERMKTVEDFVSSHQDGSEGHAAAHAVASGG